MPSILANDTQDKFQFTLNQDTLNRTMSAEEQNTLSASLTRLGEVLASKSPFIFAKLAPGANDGDINMLRSELGGAQIQCLELWYRWHNGCADHTTDLIPLGRMLSIAESLEDRKQIQGISVVDEKRKNALKILDDSAGDGFFLDITSPNPRVFYHMLEDPYPEDYGTLRDFIAFITDIHAAGLASENDHGMVAFDLGRYEQIDKNYRDKIRK